MFDLIHYLGDRMDIGDSVKGQQKAFRSWVDTMDADRKGAPLPATVARHVQRELERLWPGKTPARETVGTDDVIDW